MTYDVSCFGVIFDLKFIYSEKATKFCEVLSLLLSYVVPVKSMVEISQNLLAFAEYMNFNKKSHDIFVKNNTYQKTNNQKFFES